MPRDDRAHGVWSTSKSKGPARGRGVMKRRRRDSGLTKAEFEAMMRRLGIWAR